MSTVGRNWGDAVIDGSTLVFNVDGKPAFRFPLSDVGQVRLQTPVSQMMAHIMVPLSGVSKAGLELHIGAGL